MLRRTCMGKMTVAQSNVLVAVAEAGAVRAADFYPSPVRALVALGLVSLNDGMLTPTDAGATLAKGRSVVWRDSERCLLWVSGRWRRVIGRAHVYPHGPPAR